MFTTVADRCLTGLEWRRDHLYPSRISSRAVCSTFSYIGLLPGHIPVAQEGLWPLHLRNAQEQLRLAEQPLPLKICHLSPSNKRLNVALLAHPHTLSLPSLAYSFGYLHLTLEGNLARNSRTLSTSKLTSSF